MNKEREISTENIIAEIDNSLLKLNEDNGLGSGLKYVGGIKKLAEQLESESHKLLIRHVWNRLLIHAVVDNAIPEQLTQATPSIEKVDEDNIVRAATFRENIIALSEIWKARDLIKANMELDKAMQEFQETTTSINHKSFLLNLLRSWTSSEKYNEYQERLEKYSEEVDKYKKIPKLVRIFRKPPSPPDEPMN